MKEYNILPSSDTSQATSWKRSSKYKECSVIKIIPGLPCIFYVSEGVKLKTFVYE